MNEGMTGAPPWRMRWWFFGQFAVLVVCGTFVLAGDSRDPAWPVWFIGALIVWVAAQVASHDAVAGALIAQLLIFWGPHLYAASIVGRRGCCVCGGGAKLVSGVLVGLNLLALFASIGVAVVVRFRARAETRATHPAT